MDRRKFLFESTSRGVGLMALPFGNGPERMLTNINIGAHLHQLDFNRHGTGHLARAAQEGIAFAFRYGLDIMRENGIEPSVIRAGKANMFLSRIFTQSFVNATGVPVELYQSDGSIGAALGAGVGIGYYTDPGSAFAGRKPLQCIVPEQKNIYERLYENWKQVLDNQIQNMVGAEGMLTHA